MSIVIVICAVFLSLSALAVLVRVEKGPSMLDRMVGLDLFTSILLGAAALVSAAQRRTDLLAILVVLAIVGFISSTTVARFAANETTADKRVLSKDEVAKILLEHEEETEEDLNRPPVHNPDEFEPEARHIHEEGEG